MEDTLQYVIGKPVRCSGQPCGEVEYVVVDKNGVQHSYRSEMEAKAAVRRFGGGSIQTKTLSPTA